jgi:hypothetical protein
VGASGWLYVVPYQEDLSAALDALRRQVFAEGEFRHPDDEGLPVPGSVDDLLLDIYAEFMGGTGTHSVIDVLHLVPAGVRDQDYCTVRPLTADEARQLFGSPAPDRLDFDAVPAMTLLDTVTAGRWTGRSVVLWADGKPDEIAFWGISGD